MLRRLTRALVLVALARALGRAGTVLDGDALRHVVRHLVQHVDRVIGHLR